MLPTVVEEVVAERDEDPDVIEQTLRAMWGQYASPELDKLLANVRPGDAVVIWKLDRLGRSLKHLVKLVESPRVLWRPFRLSQAAMA